jgi:alpha-tubulin suppressor-like RCC1 family protein
MYGQTMRAKSATPSDVILFGLIVVMLACAEPREIKWTSVEAGGAYTCAIAESEESFCWGGANLFHTDPAPPRDSIAEGTATPTPVPSAMRFRSVTAGGGSFCGLTRDSTAYCWGDNSTGELGDGSVTAKRHPVQVIGGYKWTGLSMGGAHACGVTAQGDDFCWGDAFRGALGDGITSGFQAIPTPTLVRPPRMSVMYAGGGNSCGLAEDGAAFCWGANDYGVLGDGATPTIGAKTLSPTLVVGDHQFSSIAIGGAHMCALDSGGRAWCWGYNSVGQLGTYAGSASSVPVAIESQPFVAIAAGGAHTCGLTVKGEAYCWGANERGQLGNGNSSTSPTPVRVTSSEPFVSVSSGDRHTCALGVSGRLWCWGGGTEGQLGNGIFSDSPSPVLVIAR